MTLTVSSVLVVSSISTSVRAAGIAMAMRMTTGRAVQITSTLVLCTSVTSGIAPLDLRKVTIDQIIAPNTITPMTTRTQKISMCRS